MSCEVDILLETEPTNMAVLLEVGDDAFDMTLETESGARGVIAVGATPPLAVEIIDQPCEDYVAVMIGSVYLSEHYLTKQTVSALPGAGDPTVVYQLNVGQGAYDYYMWIGGAFVPMCRFTHAQEQKLDGIEAGAQRNVQSDWNETNPQHDAYIKNKPAIPAGSGTLDTTATAAQVPVANEPLSGRVTLHKIAKTGSHVDLDKPLVILESGMKVFVNGVDVTNDWRVQPLDCRSYWEGSQAAYDELVDMNQLQPGVAYFVKAQPDWAETDPKHLGYIKNKPDIMDMTMEGTVANFYYL